MVTSTALDCLSRAERIIAAEREPERSNAKRKFASQEPEVFSFPNDIQNMNDLDKSDSQELSKQCCDDVLDFCPPRVDTRRYSREYVVENKKEKPWDLTPLSYSNDCRRISTRQMALADAEDEVSITLRICK
jgi:hypothetical protein